MGEYDDLFDDIAPADSVFADKGALDPLTESDEIIAREDRARTNPNWGDRGVCERRGSSDEPDER